MLLLDEIEKAHPDLFNILLQVMDYGKLTDHNGKNVDFRNVILIMTTNAGASDLAKPAIGFGSGIRTGDDQEAINRMFTPEFRNRLDATISFAPLSPETIGRVVDKFVLQLEEQLADRNVTIELDAGARAWLAEKGYDPLFGARPLARVIQEHIKKPLAEELLFGRLAKGGIVRVTKKPDEDALAFAYRGGPGGPGRAQGAGAGRISGCCTDAPAGGAALVSLSLPERRILGQPLDLALDHVALAREELGDGAAKARVGDPMGAVGRHRQIAALQFVRALRAGLDPLQPARDRELDRPVIAALEMQEFVVAVAAPVAAVDRLLAQ